MLRKASEVRLHDDEQVVETIDAALRIAARETVPTGMREVVFVQAVGLLAQKHVEFEQVSLAAGRMAIPRGGNGR